MDSLECLGIPPSEAAATTESPPRKLQWNAAGVQRYHSIFLLIKKIISPIQSSPGGQMDLAVKERKLPIDIYAEILLMGNRWRKRREQGELNQPKFFVPFGGQKMGHVAT